MNFEPRIGVFRIRDWGFKFPIPSPKNTNPQFKITNWQFYHHLGLFTFISLLNCNTFSEHSPPLLYMQDLGQDTFITWELSLESHHSQSQIFPIFFLSVFLLLYFFFGFSDFFCIFLTYEFFVEFFLYFLYSFEVTKVNTGQQNCLKLAKKHNKLFFARRAKKALDRSPPQELEVGLCSTVYIHLRSTYTFVWLTV